MAKAKPTTKQNQTQPSSTSIADMSPAEREREFVRALQFIEAFSEPMEKALRKRAEQIPHERAASLLDVADAFVAFSEGIYLTVATLDEPKKYPDEYAVLEGVFKNWPKS